MLVRSGSDLDEEFRDKEVDTPDLTKLVNFLINLSNNNISK